MRNATSRAQYLDDDTAPDATRDEEIAAEVALYQRVTARDVRRTLATIAGAVPAFGVIRSREEDK